MTTKKYSTSSGKGTVAGFLEWRRRVGESRIAAIVSGRKAIDHRPSPEEIDASRKRWEAERHQI